MTTSSQVFCPGCHKPIQSVTGLAGKRVRCRGCGHVFTVAEAKSSRKALEDTAGSAYGLVALDRVMPLCPFCAHELPSENPVLCVQCGFNLRTRQRIGTKRVYATTLLDQILWLLPGFLSLLGIFLLLALNLFCWFSLPKLLQPGTWQFLQTPLLRSLFGLFAALAIVILGKTAWKRLIVQPLPPEREKSYPQDTYRV